MTTKQRISLNSTDQPIANWITSNIQILPGESPEAIDTWEEYLVEIIRLAMPKNIAGIQHVEAQAVREDAGEPEIVIITIEHSAGCFKLAFSINESRGQALLVPTSKVT